MHIKNYLFVILATIFMGCGGDSQSTKVSQNPTQNQTSGTNIVAKAEANVYVVEPGNKVRLSAEHSTIEGNQSVAYLWLTKEGQFLARTPTYEWQAPSQEGAYDIVLMLNAHQENESNSSITITVEAAAPVLDNNDSSFATIKKMVKLSQEGTLSDVRYICVGDSTRVFTLHEGVLNHSEKIFDDINNSLKEFSVKGYLVAQGGLALKTFLGDEVYDPSDSRAWLNIQEALDKIPADGDTTIVDISLGANDVSGLTHLYPTNQTPNYQTLYHDTVKALLLRTIHAFQEARPQVKIFLTVPNPMRDWENGAAIYQAVYKEVAQEAHLPLANFVEDIMPARYIAGTTTNTVEFLSWYNDNIHFSQNIGMPELSSFILAKILPAN